MNVQNKCKSKKKKLNNRSFIFYVDKNNLKRCSTNNEKKNEDKKFKMSKVKKYLFCTVLKGLFFSAL